MHYSGIALLLCGFCFACLAEPAKHYVVEIPSQPGIPESDYYPGLLKRVLEASKRPGEVIELRFSGLSYSQARWIAEVQKSQRNSVIWTVTSKEREQALRPIRVPLFRGLLGYRVLVVRREDLPVFAAVNTKSDLMQLTAGQGAHWPDTQILRANGLPVVEGMTPETLYKMLAAKRFDYFPRGITEVNDEADLIRRGNLAVAPRLLIIYPTAMYFFVNKQNTDLAERLEKGLDKLIKSGDFDGVLQNLPQVQLARKEFSQTKRKIIYLDNPDLPEPPSARDQNYWLRSPLQQ